MRLETTKSIINDALHQKFGLAAKRPSQINLSTSIDVGRLAEDKGGEKLGGGKTDSAEDKGGNSPLPPLYLGGEKKLCCTSTRSLVSTLSTDE